ncbi:NAD(P)/FAD-dependent oxidoreductase [Paenalcaligenes faecalis]|uniref:NAD(P)/FAD-dependent oxidoreductase n=1 Tax=Paenalcaligenes faecalis TaxID=2980099 RepID=UPI0022B9A343|nr:FAD-dependent oxidoreductase [Paenalcaligenes faecalis]
MQKPQIHDRITHRPSAFTPLAADWSWADDAQFAVNDLAAHYYEASLDPWPGFEAVQDEVCCDVAVIGGGLLGLSTALHLAENGVDVVLIEADRVAGAASGRNGGQLTPGLARWDAGTMVDQLGEAEARRLWRFSGAEAMSTVQRILADYELDVGYRQGHLTAAVHPGHMAGMLTDADLRRHLGDDSVELVGAHQIQEFIASDVYHGAAFDHLGGQVHPLALSRGLAYALHKNGVKIHEKSRVQAITKCAQGHQLICDSGRVLARKSVVLAAHVQAPDLLPDRMPTAVPGYTYVSVTKPIEGGVQSLIPSLLAVYDSRIQIDYFRPVAGERLLYGGLGTGTRWSPEKTRDYFMGRLTHVFHQRDDLALDFCWSGTFDLTLNGATDSRYYEDLGIYSVHGWSGHGVAQTIRIGKAISDDFLAKNEDYRMLTAIEHKGLPLGKQVAPLVIPSVSGLMTLKSWLRPAEMQSF